MNQPGFPPAAFLFRNELRLQVVAGRKRSALELTPLRRKKPFRVCPC